MTEFLDLIFNTSKINQLLKHSDLLKSEPFEKQYEKEKIRQTKLNKSDLMELDRQIKHSRYLKNKNNSDQMKSFEEIGRIIAAKEISDVFKIDKV